MKFFMIVLTIILIITFVLSLSSFQVLDKFEQRIITLEANQEIQKIQKITPRSYCDTTYYHKEGRCDTIINCYSGRR